MDADQPESFVAHVPVPSQEEVIINTMSCYCYSKNGLRRVQNSCMLVLCLCSVMVAS